MSVSTTEHSDKRSRTRARLLDAAYEVFAGTGLHVATIEQVTERAGFTRGAFYSNFSSKEELFFAVVDRENERGLEALAAGLSRLPDSVLTSVGGPDPAVLGELIVDVLSCVETGRQWHLVELEFELLAMRDPQIAGRIGSVKTAFETSLAAIIDQAVRRFGLEPRMSPLALSRTLAAVYDSTMRRSFLHGDDTAAAAARARDELLEVLLAVVPPPTH